MSPIPNTAFNPALGELYKKHRHLDPRAELGIPRVFLHLWVRIMERQVKAADEFS